METTKVQQEKNETTDVKKKAAFSICLFIEKRCFFKENYFPNVFLESI